MTSMLNSKSVSDKNSHKFFFEGAGSLLYKIVALLISQSIDKIFLSFFGHFSSFVKQEISIIISETALDETEENKTSETKSDNTSITELYDDL